MIQVPPNDKDLEEIIIGCMLIDKKAYEEAADIINLDCFYNPKYATIYSTCQKIYNKTEPIDIVTVSKQIEVDNNIETIGGLYELTKMTDRISSTANLKTYCRKLFELWLKRSEEHTSELQSRFELVCRLLLEKK